MAKTLADLRVGVRTYLDESAQIDFKDSEVDAAINFAYHDVVSEVMSVYEQYYYTTTPLKLSTVANQQEYPLSATIIKTSRVEIIYKPSDPNAKPLRAKALRIDELPRYLSDPDVGGSSLWNCGYYLTGSEDAQVIGFVPPPKESGTDNISVWGVVAPSDLVNPTDPVKIPYPDRFAWLINIKAACDLLRKGQQEEAAAAKYEVSYMANITRMKNFIKDRTSDGPWVIEDAEMQDVAFDYSY